MAKVFNITADCKPGQHYMVNLDKRLEEIKKLIDAGQYFTINRARQYGKTTTLRASSHMAVQTESDRRGSTVPQPILPVSLHAPYLFS